MLLAVLAAAAALQPAIVQKPIPFPAKRRAEMAAYARKHYGLDTWQLRNPRVIVEHLTANTSFASTYATFAPDRPDAELHELGFTGATDVVGGFAAWAAAGLPVETAP